MRLFGLVYMNDAACAEFGVSRNVALHLHLLAAAQGFFSEAMVAHLHAASKAPGSSVFEVPDEGGVRWYELRCFPRSDGMSIYCRNVTERVASRRSLREQAELLDKAQDAIFVQDLEHSVVYWNKSATRLFGWTAEEAIGRRVEDLFTDAREAMLEATAVVIREGEWSGELSQHHRDGVPLVVESRYTLVRGEDGAERSILAINTDITTRKAAEAKIQRLAYYDVLTGLPNRLLLRQRLEEALESSVANGSMGALLFIDLDDFKTFNDTRGHDVGDLLL